LSGFGKAGTWSLSVGSWTIGSKSAGWTGNSFPDEPDFVQKSLLIKSHFVVLMIAPLISDPLP
jgi:hypothetical protein